MNTTDTNASLLASVQESFEPREHPSSRELSPEQLEADRQFYLSGRAVD